MPLRQPNRLAHVHSLGWCHVMYTPGYTKDVSVQCPTHDPSILKLNSTTTLWCLLNERYWLAQGALKSVLHTATEPVVPCHSLGSVSIHIEVRRILSVAINPITTLHSQNKFYYYGASLMRRLWLIQNSVPDTIMATEPFVPCPFIEVASCHVHAKVHESSFGATSNPRPFHYELGFCYHYDAPLARGMWLIQNAVPDTIMATEPVVPCPFIGVASCHVHARVHESSFGETSNPRPFHSEAKFYYHTMAPH
ncbi:hypothetical protein AVEN_103822-1 [Araneus ventricosus]|uniref:Uncharacterized protein n=1 Tax=Araneus ventricosus TaxID=182803 RepID=A0A4Y2SNI6_ARAVE|nr:hypothetical protein AVEN_103822-1 [Araneus ventricosus]